MSSRLVTMGSGILMVLNTVHPPLPKSISSSTSVSTDLTSDCTAGGMTWTRCTPAAHSLDAMPRTRRGSVSVLSTMPCVGFAESQTIWSPRTTGPVTVSDVLALGTGAAMSQPPAAGGPAQTTYVCVSGDVGTWMPRSGVIEASISTTSPGANVTTPSVLFATCPKEN